MEQVCAFCWFSIMNVLICQWPDDGQHWRPKHVESCIIHTGIKLSSQWLTSIL